MSSWNQKIKLKQSEYGLLAIQNYDYIIQTLENIPIRNTINPEKISFMQNIGKSSMLNGAGLKSKFSMIGGRISSLQGGFGGRISTLQNNNLARISMINKGKMSTLGLGVNNNSKMKASVVNLNRNSVISGYQSLFQGLNVQQQIPGMERTSVLSQRQKGITNILNKKQKFLNEVFDFDLKIDISGLKQPFIVYEAMKEKTVSTQIFLKLRESQLMEIVEREKIENQQQLKQFAQNIIGFLIIEKQLFQQLSILNQSQNMNDVQLLAKQFRSVEKKIRGFFANIFDENEFIPAKNIVYLFAYLLEMLNFTSGSQSLILILQAQLQLFSDRMIYNIKKKLTDQIQKQSFEYHKVNNRQEYLAYTKIFNIYNDEIDDEEDNIDSYFDQQTMAYRASTKKSTIQNQQQFNKQFDLPFSAVLALITENIEYFIEQQIGFLKGYYQKRIEYLQRIKPEQEFKSYQTIEKIKLKATDYIIDQMINKIDSLLENYKEVNYSPNYPNKECHYFIQDLIDYLTGAIQSIAMIRQDLVYSIIYPIFKRINEYIWEILVGKYMKQINICGIRNLELDLLSLFELCGTHFENEISNCGGIHMLGGYGLLADDQIEKQFTEIPSHQFIRIKANYHFIDSWSGETGYMKIGTKENNEYIWTQSYDYNKAMDSINVCGSQYGEGKLTEHIDVTFRHSEQDLFIVFGSTLNNDAFDNSYGISNLQIYLM
ncbi:hypothetical protein PPERSA_12382 [Pseudocohnilembus persalinus]|uniref:Exocyst complex subunit EXOC6/Sec15 C-terminal domain-containing protein n=1 Tax=Pseudocohnilembus persalinus TaxID=266149 RepID=A0A0V0Q875_PSEPJ|nr:hypothetical protein PPERSA_12382 [Pseudocohnilembus persalinus]|eukprot:KRW98425.1 hypothetical protein PPERSA_12382 [Pseudocohnilembus persalinus]